MRRDKRPSRHADTAAEQVETLYDVFLSYNSRDKPVVERLAERLKRGGIEPWFDAWSLAPGADWQTEVAEGIARSASCAVFIGPADIGAWEHMEMQVAVDRHVSDPDFRVFLVLLPGLPDQFDAQLLPPFLRMRTWVDYRDGLDNERAFASLVSAVNGLPLGPSVPIAPVEDVCPYRGLDIFDEKDAEFFFGRDRDVQRLREKLKGTRFLAVLGASGSGKSSLVRAGLLPEMRREGFEITVLRPGVRPLESLAARLLQLGGRAAMQGTVDGLREDERTLHLATSLIVTNRAEDGRVLVVVDQFEEVFTLCRDERERRAFFANLLYAATIPGGAASVVLTMRADFYHRCGAYPELAQSLAAEQYLVSPLDRDGLRQTIEEPARLVGLSLEAGLAQTILDDVAGQPGVLPLLEHALLELWERRIGGMLTLAGYQETGGVQGAIAKRADEIFDGLTSGQQELARRMFLRLTQPGEGTEDTRRRAPLAELAPAENDDLDVVLRALVDARLLTTSHDDVEGDVVEVAHEALIRGWPHLRAWIEEDRAGLRLHRRLTEAAREWERLGRDPGGLYRGARLAQALEWRATNEDDLNASEREFLDASAAAEHNELEQAQRRARRLRILAGSLGVVVAAAVATATLALVARSDATRQRDVANSASLQTRADSQKAYLDVALLLSLAAESRRHSAQVDEGVTTALIRARSTRAWAILHDDTAVANAVAWSPHGHLLATASANGTVRLWDLQARKRLGRLVGDGGYLNAVAFDPRGGVVAAGGKGGVFLWSLRTHRLISHFRVSNGAVTAVAYRPRAGMLVAGTDAGEVWQWRLPKGVGMLRYRAPSSIWGVAVNADGTIAVADGEQTAVLLGPGSRPARRLPQLPERILAVAFSPDGRTLAIGRGHRDPAGHDTGSVQLWDAQTLRKTSEPIGNSSDFILSISFSRGGSVLAGTGPEGTVHLWDTRTKTQEDAFSADAGHLHGVAFDPADDRMFAAAANDGEVLVWRRGRAAFGAPTAGADERRELVTGYDGGTIRLSGPHTRTIAGAGRVARVSLSDDGDWLAAFAPAGFVRVWSTASGEPIARIVTGAITALAVDDKGEKLASGGGSGAVRLWDVRSQRLIAPVLRGHSGEVRAIAFNPTRTMLATGGADSATYLWDARTHRRLAALRLGGAISTLAFSPDGRVLATGQEDGIRLWDARAHTLLADRFGPGSPTSVVFSRDGRRLLSEDYTTHGRARPHVWAGILWSTPADLRRQVCSLVFPGITRDEWRELAPDQKYRTTCPVS